jgi:hypothetical protein
MKKLIPAVFVVAVLGFAGVRPASAQSDTAIVKVPFDFIVGDRVLPAGSYRIAPDMNDSTLLFVTSTRGTTAAAFAATGWTPNPNRADGQAHVAFKNVDGHMFLWQVAMPGADAREVTVTKTGAERTLARLNLMPAERADSAK